MKAYFSDARDWPYTIQRQPDLRLCFVTYGQYGWPSRCVWFIPGTFVE